MRSKNLPRADCSIRCLSVLARGLGHLRYVCQRLCLVLKENITPAKAVILRRKFAHTTACSRCPLHWVRDSANRSTQGAYTVSLTPSAQLIWLWLVERTRLLALFETVSVRRFARLWLGRLGYGQRLGLGLLRPCPLAHYLAHTHTGFPVVWGDAKSPPRNDKYLGAKNCATKFCGCRLHFGQGITPTSCLARATHVLRVRQWRHHTMLSSDQSAQPTRDGDHHHSRASDLRNIQACASKWRAFPRSALCRDCAACECSLRCDPAMHCRIPGYLLRLLN